MTARPGSTATRRNPTVGWFELFYDLVVVASVTLTNDAYLTEPTVATARAAVLGILALSWIWLLTTLFNNLLPGRGLLRHVLLLLQMAAIVSAGLAIDDDDGINARAALLAYGIAIAVLVLLIALVPVAPGRTKARTRLRRDAVIPLLIAVGLCAIGALAVPDQAGVLFAIAVAVSIIPIIGWQFPRWNAQGLVRLDHLRERLGLFIIIILGEGFAQLAASLHGIGSIPRGSLYALTFLVSFALWWIYFDGTFTERTDLTRVRWRLSILGHLTLVYGMAGTLDILVLLTAGEESEFGFGVLRYLALSVALVLGSFTLLRFSASGRLQAPGWLQVGSCLVVLLLGFVAVHDGMEDLNWVILTFTVIVIFNAAASAWFDRSGDVRTRLASMVAGIDEAD